MIRAVSTASLVALLILVLYLPSAYPPQRFLKQLRTEHAMTAAFWNHDHALHILARMLEWQVAAQQATPIPSLTDAPPPTTPVDLAVAKQMAAANARLFHNPYFRAVDTLLVLATYRFCALLEWLPFLLAVMLAVLFDGAMLRIIKSREFLHHDPEIFALYGSAAVLTLCATVVVLLLPVTVHPLALPVVPLAVSAFASRALASFHRRA